MMSPEFLSKRTGHTTAENFPAFALTAAPLLLWYLAGLLTDPGHRKSLDYGAFAVFFCFGPILVWLISRRIASVTNSASDRLAWGTAIQALLTLAVLGLIWVPFEILSNVWYVPLLVHITALLVLCSRSNALDQLLTRHGFVAIQVVAFLAPLLPGLVLLSAFIYSPSIRSGLLLLFSSTSFVLGLVGGTLIAVFSLALLRKQHLPFSYSPAKRIAGLIAACFAFVAMVMLFDTTLWFDWIHYGTYIGPANAVLHGRIPTVDAFSQYGVLNYLLYTVGFIFAPLPSLTAAAAVSSAVNIVTSTCMLLLLRRLCGITWFSLLFGVLAVYVASHLAPFPMNPYPNFRGMRFLPAALITVALAYVPVGRRFTIFSGFSFAFGLLWSFEGAVCVLGSYVAFLVVVETTWAERFRSLFRLVLLAFVTYGTLTTLTYAASGTWPRFDVYLNLVFGYVSVGTYAAANWLKAIDPHELLWVPLTVLYFGVVAVAWRSVAERQFVVATTEGRTHLARISAVAACGTILLSLFVFRSLTVYLLVAAPLGLILMISLTATAWSNLSSSQFARLATAVPFVITVALSSAILSNIFKEKDVAKVVPHDVSAAHDWVRTKAKVFPLAWQRLSNPDSDFDIGMSFPWKPHRLREASQLVEKWFSSEKQLIALMPEAAALFLREGKADRLPISYSLSELMTPSVADHVVNASANVKLFSGEKILVSNHMSEINPLEVRIFKNILKHWDAVPVDKGRFLTVYQLQRKSSIASSDRLSLPLQAISATASSHISALYSASAAVDWWEVTNWSSVPTKASSSEWLQVDLGAAKYIRRIEIVPFWPILDAFPTRFSVLTSVDGISWTTVASEERFQPNWTDYQKHPTAGYEITTDSIQLRWIRLVADTPYSQSQRSYGLQIAEILAFEQ